MNAVFKQVKPSKSILDKDFVYRNSSQTSVAETWAKWRAEQAKPITVESYQRDVLAEHRARKIKSK